jgi:hypothetical protein
MECRILLRSVHKMEGSEEVKRMDGVERSAV